MILVIRDWKQHGGHDNYVRRSLARSFDQELALTKLSSSDSSEAI